MTLEEIAKFCQRQLEMVPLLIVGSGASAAHGFPTMGKLAQYLLNNINYCKGTNEYDIWDSFQRELNSSWDLEQALNKVYVNDKVLQDIIKNTWVCINLADSWMYHSIIDNAIELPLARLIRWQMSKANPRLSVVTTNYDKVAEYAASINNCNIYTGFSNNCFGYLNSGRNQQISIKCEGLEGQVDIWKVHGSLDWFRLKDGTIKCLSLGDLSRSDIVPMIVTPGVTKYHETHKDPFRTIMSNADREINKAKSFFCIGYGFNDDHIQPQLIDRVKSKAIPLIVITKELTDSTKKIFLSGKYKEFLLIEESKASPDSSTIYHENCLSGETIDQDIWQLNNFLKTILSI